LMERTEMGAATDRDGRYLIFNVPPGHYTLQASAIGYQDVVETVDLSPGQARKLDLAFSHPHLWLPATRYAAQFGVFRAGLVWPGVVWGHEATQTSAFLARAGRLELGHFAIAVQRELWPTVSVDCRLFEWFDEGGTRLGQPAVLPLYLTVADGPWTNGLFDRRPLERIRRALGRRLDLGRVMSVGGPCFYAYVMGSASRSVGAGIGTHLLVSAHLRTRLHLIPGLELSWRHSWNGQSRFSALSLGVSLGLGSRELPPQLYRV
jgi:hypothetical protein